MIFVYYVHFFFFSLAKTYIIPFVTHKILVFILNFLLLKSTWLFRERYSIKFASFTMYQFLLDKSTLFDIIKIISLGINPNGRIGISRTLYLPCYPLPL